MSERRKRTISTLVTTYNIPPESVQRLQAEAEKVHALVLKYGAMSRKEFKRRIKELKRLRPNR